MCFLNSGCTLLRGEVSGAVVSVQLQKSVCSLPFKDSRFYLPGNTSGLARPRAYGPRIRPFMVQETMFAMTSYSP